MKFPNLVWSIRFRRLAHYQLAMRVEMEPSRFSRCLTGRFDFSSPERRRVSQILGFNERWLFCEPIPAPLTEGEPVRTTTARAGEGD